MSADAGLEFELELIVGGRHSLRFGKAALTPLGFIIGQEPLLAEMTSGHLASIVLAISYSSTTSIASEIPGSHKQILLRPCRLQSPSFGITIG